MPIGSIERRVLQHLSPDDVAFRDDFPHRAPDGGRSICVSSALRRPRAGAGSSVTRPSRSAVTTASRRPPAFTLRSAGRARRAAGTSDAESARAARIAMSAERRLRASRRPCPFTKRRRSDLDRHELPGPSPDDVSDPVRRPPGHQPREPLPRSRKLVGGDDLLVVPALEVAEAIGGGGVLPGDDAAVVGAEDRQRKALERLAELSERPLSDRVARAADGETDKSVSGSNLPSGNIGEGDVNRSMTETSAESARERILRTAYELSPGTGSTRSASTGSARRPASPR
jgi:hypothetical protein